MLNWVLIVIINCAGQSSEKHPASAPGYAAPGYAAPGYPAAGYQATGYQAETDRD
jgi:hypothetical protein